MDQSIQSTPPAAPPVPAGDELRHKKAADEDFTPGPWSVAIGDWIHRHKDITHNLLGYTGYQFLRSAAAAVPYGISMPLTWYGMMKLTDLGDSIKKTGEAAGSGWKVAVGSNLSKFAGAKAVRASAIIGTSFTCYRGMSKIGNWTRQQLFDENDSRDQTIEKVHYYWTDLGNKFREIAPAEIHSTPLAAIVLGFITSNFDVGKVPDELKWMNKTNINQAVQSGTRLRFMKDVLFNPKARFVEQAAINTIGYSLFFELADRLYKDKQLERRVWQGDPHNISNKAGSADPSAALADDDEAEKLRIINKFGKRLHHGQVKRPEPKDNTYGFFTDEPSLGRFMFRRVLPTSIGISAYTALKMRHSYMWLGGPFPDIDSVRGWRDIPKNIKREGLAVTLFFLIPWVADPWARFYDNFFAKLEGKNKPPSGAMLPQPMDEPTQRVAENNEKLLTRLSEKDRQAGRA